MRKRSRYADGVEPVVALHILKKYGIRQTTGDAPGIGGIFRGLRTIPVIDAMIEEMHHVAPNAILAN